jgi:DNA-binding response OmpR family regulator
MVDLPTPILNVDRAELERAADEGVPIGALRRIYRCDPSLLREYLHAAVASGRLIEMPREDWPPLTPRDQRTPTVAAHKLVEDDREATMRMARKLKTTKLESRILLVLLRRGHASREQLHMAVEDNRGNPDDETDIKIVDVVVCKLRKKLAPIGLKMTTIHSIGYEMSEEHRNKAWELINA